VDGDPVDGPGVCVPGVLGVSEVGGELGDADESLLPVPDVPPPDVEPGVALPLSVLT
jgi:hypothetical protein